MADPLPDLRAALAADLDAAFPAFVEAEMGRIYGIALRLTGRPADAEDLAQDTLVRAYRALAGWEPSRIRELAVRPWLASIVVNLARNRARARASRPTTVSLVDELAHPRIAGPRDAPRPAGPARGRRGLGGPPARPARALPGAARPAPRRRPVLRRDRPGARSAGRHGQGPGPPRDRACSGPPSMPSTSSTTPPHRQPEPARRPLEVAR